MRYITSPEDDAIQVFLNCISLVRNPNLKSRLTACQNLISDAHDELNNKVTTDQLHTIIREELVNGNVTAKELGDVYTNRMAKKNMPGRDLYDRIKISAPYGVCPLCSQREATTLDHYLPKAEYPRLSVMPINLVPSCKDCNTIKTTIFPDDNNEGTLHPYYDNIENEKWLGARIIRTNPPIIRFFVQAPEHWSDLLKGRIKHHFDSLAIQQLYSTHAASELRQINYRLNVLFDQYGANGIRIYLLDAAETRSHDNINSWQAVMYNTTANDNWFCNGGFALNVPV